MKLDEGAYKPERAHDSDAGLDLRSREDAVVPAGGSHSFDTGVHFKLEPLAFNAITTKPTYSTLDDDNFSEEVQYQMCKYVFKTAGFVKSKSGLFFNHNIISTGTVDYSYRGAVKVKLVNLGKEDYHVKKGDKIAQLVITPVLTPELEVVSELDETERGEAGFGSTGR